MDCNELIKQAGEIPGLKGNRAHFCPSVLCA